MKNVMKKRVLIKLIVFIIIIFVISLVIYYMQAYKQKNVCINNNCFVSEVAKTNAERGQGLMYRIALDNDKGMLFIFDKEGIYSFWMKNTLIHLDMIWIDKNNNIVFIKENAQPCLKEVCEVITPNEKALYVLEVNSGNVEKYNIKLGDEVSIN